MQLPTVCGSLSDIFCNVHDDTEISFPQPSNMKYCILLAFWGSLFFFFSSHESTACCDSLNIYSDKPAFLSLPQSLQDAAQAISVTIKKWALLKKRIQFSLFSSSISATPKYQIVFKGKVTIYLGQGVNGEQERRKSSSNTESIVSNQLFNQSHHHYIFSSVHAWVGGKAS